MPDVSVIAVTANSRDDVSRMLAEVQAQLDVELEIVVVDNGSTDGTVEALGTAPDLRVIANDSNRWLAPAWMQGVRESTGRLLLFLTPDLSLEQRDAVARLREALESDPLAAVAGPCLLDAEGRDLRNGSFAWPSPRWIVATSLGLGRPLRLHKLPQRSAVEDDTKPRQVRFVNGACMLVRRDALEVIGGFDEGYRLYWEEIDLARRLDAAGYRILLVPAVVGVHRGKGSPTAAGFRELAFAHGERLYVRRHHGYAAFLAVMAARRLQQLRSRLTGRSAGPFLPR